MLDDLIKRADLNSDDYAMVIFITDGCAGQYKCGTALYLMAMHAQQTGRMFYHFSKCAGQGKCHCDAEGGCHKTFCDMAFGRFVMIPEQERVGNCWAPSRKVKSGLIVSLARTVYTILQDKDYM